MNSRGLAPLAAAALAGLLTVAAAAPTRPAARQDPVEPARAALRTLQFERAVALLNGDPLRGNRDAQYLLGLVYLNGVGVIADHGLAMDRLKAAAGQGHAAAAYVIAAELARDPDAPPAESRRWLERSAGLGYPLAVAALRSGRPLLDRESLGVAEPALRASWVIHCARSNDAAELRRLGAVSAAVRDEFARSALSHAAHAGALAAATVLLELGADVNAADVSGTTALMLAAAGPETAVLDLLLQHGAEPRAVDLQGRTPLFYAARADRVDSVKRLQLANALIDARDSRGYNALDAALGVGAAAAAGELRSMGLRANRVTIEPGRQSGRFDAAHPGAVYRGWPPLALAVVRNDAATVRQLLGDGGDANLRLPQGVPLVQVAADARALQTLGLLLAARADPGATNGAGHSLPWLAAARDDTDVLTVLLQGGVPPDTHAPTEHTPLVEALRSRQPRAAATLLGAGANAEATDAEGRTPLLLACAGGDAALVKLLLEHHALVNAADHAQRSALWHAAAAGSPGIVSMLLQAGADPRVVDDHGLSALHAAAGQPAAAVLEPLLARDLPLNNRDHAGDTPLLIAAGSGHAEIVRTLLARSAELDAQNGAGDTALIAASRGGHAGISRLLTAAGANKSLRNGVGVTAADVAAARGFAAIARDLGGKG